MKLIHIVKYNAWLLCMETNKYAEGMCSYKPYIPLKGKITLAEATVIWNNVQLNNSLCSSDEFEEIELT
jgi:hypothetical protein